jgi:uncharacterized membrane protein
LKLSNDQKKIIKAIAIYTPVYIVALLLSHWIRDRSFSWEDLLVSVLTAVVLGLLLVLFFVVGSHVPTKDDQ